MSDMYTAGEVGKMRIREAEREAGEQWCYRDTRVREHKLLNRVLVSVRGLFTRL